MNRPEHWRRSIRLPGYDYASVGAYFVTVCTDKRALLLASAEFQAAVEDAWNAIPEHFHDVGIDAFVVMPNHIHGIVWILPTEEGPPGVVAQHAAPPQPAGWRSTVKPGSIGAIVRSFKSASTKRLNELRSTPGAAVWQPNYYERVIRNDDELNRIREYIQLNPLKWNLDRDNPMRTPNTDWDRQWEWLEGQS